MSLRFFLPTLAAIVLAACSATPQPAAPVPLSGHVDADGLVEPLGEERLIVPQVTGRVERVLVEEGDHVEAGQVLAEIDSAEQRAALLDAEAQVALRAAQLEALRNGPRPEEIGAARAVRDEAAARAQQAAREAERRDSMAARGLISVEERDAARTAAATAAAVRRRAQAELDLLLAGTRREDLEAAVAALDAARAQRERAAATLEKTRIRSPIAGVVLKRGLNAGETVTPFAPEPVATIGNLERLMVRADVDELDVSRVQVGASAAVSADAFPRQSFSGEVVQVARRMGERSARSDDPTRRRDARTMEALIALAPGAALPVGLRVDVRIEASPPPNGRAP